MRGRFPLFVIFLSLFSLCWADTLFSKSVAVLAIEDSRLPGRLVRRAGGALTSSLKDTTGLQPVSAKKVRSAVDKDLRKILEEEIDRAQDLFYKFQFREARHLLEGRDDLEAIQWRAMIAAAQGKEGEVRQEWIRLIERNPNHSLSSRDFPPRLIALFEELKRKERHDRQSPLVLKIAKGITLTEAFPYGWSDRLVRLAQEHQWNSLIVYRLEPIGWNYKFTVTLFSYKPPNQGVPFEAVELVDLKNLGDAAKILVKSVFSVDTPAGLH